MFAKFTGKLIFWSLIFNEIAGDRPVIFFNNTQAELFSCKLCELFQNTFFMKHLQVTASTYQMLCVFYSFDNCNYLKNVKFNRNNENNKTLKTSNKRSAEATLLVSNSCPVFFIK